MTSLEREGRAYILCGLLVTIVIAIPLIARWMQR
jgi:hypothetical protein